MPPAKPRGFGKPANAKKTIFRILSYMGKYKHLWIIVCLCVFTSSITAVLGNYLIKPALNDYIIPLINQENPDFSDFFNLLVKALSLLLLGVLASWGNSRLMIHISTSLLLKIRCDLFSKMEKLPISFYDAHTHGELMSRFTNDTDTLREMMSQTVPQLLSSLISVLSVFVMMIVLSPMLTIIMILTMLLLLLFVTFVGKRSVKAFRQNQKSIGEMNGYIEEMIEVQKVIKVFNYEERAKKQFGNLNENLRNAGTRAMIFGGLMGPITNNMSHAQYAIIAIVGSVFMIGQYTQALPINWFTGLLDIGTFAAFLQYIRSFTQPISMMSQQANSVLNALAGAERIFAIIDQEAEVDEGKYALINAYDAKDSKGNVSLVQAFSFTGQWAWKNPQNSELKKLQGEVVFDDVTFGYKAEKNVLHNINIHAKPGQKIALVGSTGSGKTTIINLLTRFYDVAEGNGKITYDGIPLNEISKDALRKSLGMVQQNTHLFTGTIRENIRYGNLNASDAQVYQAAKLANADSFIQHLEEGYDTVITADGSSLSQGQRQLLAIARAAIADPPVLILDEATSSIDTRTEKLIEKGMDSLMKNRTTFVIAHRLSTVRNADEIIVLEHGKIIERGSHDQLIQAKGRYYFLYTGNKISLSK